MVQGTTAYTFANLDGRDDTRSTGSLPEGITFEPGINTLELDSHVAADTYNLAHQVTDGNNRTVFANVQLAVTSPVFAQLQVADATFRLTKASTGRLEFDLPVATGGQSPLSYDINDADLVNGISEGTEANRNYIIVDRNDVAAGTHTLRLTVTDARGVTATSNITVEAYGPVAVAKPDDIVVQWNQRRTEIVLPAATGGSGNYSYGLSNLPGSATFDTESRALIVSGDLIPEGTYNLTYTVTDDFDNTNTASQTLSLRRLARPTLVLDSTLNNLSYYRDADGNTDDKTVTLPAATGGTAPYTYNLTQTGQATLPAGITFNKTSRVLTVAPDTMPLGMVRLTYTPADSTGATQPFSFTVTNNAAMALAKPRDIAIDSITQRTVVNLPLATGGSGNFTYEITGNPAGTQITTNPPAIQYSSGVARGGYTVSYKATDTVSNDSITQTFEIRSTAVPSPALRLPVLSDITYISTADVQRVFPGATGGKSPYTYSITGLPSGASFNASTRTLSLTPNIAGGLYNLSYVVVDSDGRRTAQSFRLSVVQVEGAIDLQLGASAPVAFEENLRSSQVLGNATGGTAPYTYSLTKANGDPLPAGMSFSASSNTLVYTVAPRGRYLLKHTVTDSSTVQQEVSRFVEVSVEEAQPQPSAPQLPALSTIILRYGARRTIVLPEAVGGAGDFWYQLYATDGRFLQAGTVWDESTRTLRLQGVILGDERYTYRAIDAQGNVATRTFSVITSPDALQVSSTGGGQLSIGCEPVVVGTLDIRGGVPPYNFQIDDGGHQDFSVVGNQIIAGADTVAGNRNVDITVRDAGEGEQTVQLALNISRAVEYAQCARLQAQAGAGESLQLPQNIINLITYEGIPFNVQLAQGQNGTAPYAYRLDGLPSDLRFDPDTQKLSGTLEDAGVYGFDYSISDAEGKSFRIQYTLENRRVEDFTTRFDASFVYAPEEIEDLYDAKDPLNLDISFMVRYKDSIQCKVSFVEFGGETTVLNDWSTERGGFFALTQRGSAINLLLDSQVVGTLIDMIQAGKTGVFVIEVRSFLKPGEHFAEFSSGNLPAQAIQDEFSRLDIQDHSKERLLQANAQNVTTVQLQDEAVEANKLANASVFSRHLVAGAVSSEDIQDGSVDEKHLGTLDTKAIANRGVNKEKIASGAVQAKHLNANFLGFKTLNQLDRHAVSADKIEQESVTGDKLRRHAVDTRNIEDGAVTGDKIPRGALDLSLHAPELAVPQAPREDAVSTQKIQDSAVQARHLGDDLQRYTKVRFGAADVEVANPDNIQVGEPCGVRLVDGVLTVFRLQGDYPNEEG